jgi:hypothetical protein
MSSAPGASKPVYPPLVLLAIAAAAALSSWGALDFYRSASSFAEANPDRHGIAAATDRFRPAAAILPESAVVGYLSDVRFGDVRGSTAFFGAQYALAPRLLVPYPGRHEAPWVVGNFSRPVNYQELARSHDLEVVQDLGRGLAVFRKLSR